MEVAWDEEATQQWWFTRASSAGDVEGPFTPEEMDWRYRAGQLASSSLVRWLPLAYTKPTREEQVAFEFAPLSMLCGDGGEPPFSSTANGRGRGSTLESILATPT
eukprot:1909818-Prymnesium_polylepis.1